MQGRQLFEVQYRFPGGYWQAAQLWGYTMYDVQEQIKKMYGSEVQLGNVKILKQ